MKEIERKLAAGERLTQADGEVLFASADLHALGAPADAAKRRRHGGRVYYVLNRHINYTNVCALACRVCGFGRKRGEAGAYELSVAEIGRIAADAAAGGARELHITGALHPDWPLQRYVEMVQAIRAAAPEVHIKAFTAVEIDYMARLSGHANCTEGEHLKAVEEVLRKLVAAGLQSMPGGGAEIFDSQIRRRLFPDKIDGRQWLEIHRIAHRLGLRTNATMLYGHLEKPAHRVAHLLALRDLQDQTGGFRAFVPLSFVPPKEFSSETLEGLSFQGTTGLDDLRTIAVSRLLLDNFEHIKTFWPMHTLKLSPLALHFGADDIDGTVQRYEIVSQDQPQALAAGEICRLMRESGLEPVERDGQYRPVSLH